MKYALVALAIVAAHAAVFVALAQRGDADLEVDLRDGSVPVELRDRVERRVDGDGPGLRRRWWTVRYRGGFVREVGATELVGPFQDPGRRGCTGRVIVGQRVLGDAIARATAVQIDRALRDTHVLGVGDYVRVEDVALRWTRDVAFGYVRATARVVFDRLTFKLVVALVPYRDGDRLAFHVRPRAELEVHNTVVQFLSDKLGGDRLATYLAGRQLDDALVTAFAPPPPFDLGDGQELAFVFCDEPIEIADGAYGALPFGVRIARGPRGVLPPRFGRGARPTPSADIGLALELDLDALDAILHELWRTGWLDRRLVEVGLDKKFAADPVVAEFLAVRISPPKLALPPVVAAAPDGRLRLGADARIAITDVRGAPLSTGRVFGALRFNFDRGAKLGVAADLDAIELACEKNANVLVPCYADLVAALRDRGADFHGALTDAFAGVLEKIFVDRRVGDPSLPVALAIRGVVPSLASAPGAPPTLHLALDAEIVDK